MNHWWSLAPAAILIVGLYSRSNLLAWLLLCVAGLGWMVYGVSTDQVGVWVVGALMAAFYYFRIQELARPRRNATLGGEDNIDNQE